jgi:hypothetical protein
MVHERSKSEKGQIRQSSKILTAELQEVTVADLFDAGRWK